MNIIIPVGGKGERFASKGYKTPKALIPIFGKCIIEYVLQQLRRQVQEDDRLYIFYNKDLDVYPYNFKQFLNTQYPGLVTQAVAVPPTKGAAETLQIGLDGVDLELNRKCLVVDCDTFYTQNIVALFRASGHHNMVFCTHNTEEAPIYSYVTLDENGWVTKIAEKNKISHWANTGAYGFRSTQELQTYCKRVVLHSRGEPYTSCVLAEMLLQIPQIMCQMHELRAAQVFSLGTPQAVEAFVQRTHCFLFDLDGTLVWTDDIYFEVWREILLPYNIFLTPELFQQYIQGNNDLYVFNTLLANVAAAAALTLTQLSAIKDQLFLHHMPSKLKFIPGAAAFVREIKDAGHNVCIVTNSNARVAKEIVAFMHLDGMVDFVVSSSDCQHGKPHSEPYTKALARYGLTSAAHNCFIFEDSKSGLLSAKGVDPHVLVGVETIYSSTVLHTLGAHLSLKDFCKFNVSAALALTSSPPSTSPSTSTSTTIDSSNIAYIKQLLLLQDPRQVIQMNDTKLKGGFIADVLQFTVVNATTDNERDRVVKYENTHESGNNNLSSMAIQLALYEREYYFYTHIVSALPTEVKTAKYYHLITAEEAKEEKKPKEEKETNTGKKQGRVIGVVLENLLAKNFVVNVNLNTASVDVALRVVNRMAKLHATFWGQDLKSRFPRLKIATDETFCPFFNNFIQARYPCFQKRWFKILNSRQQTICNNIAQNFASIQASLATGANLTFIHGDIKSPNMFYDTLHQHEPYFIDWQHCAIGKGVQDLIFFVLESFDQENVKLMFELIQHYYYKKITEYGVSAHLYPFATTFTQDLYAALCYVPFFTSIWFGTTPQDELIDKNFPYFLITKMCFLLEALNF